MPLFRYEAYERTGTKKSGTVDAASLLQAREMIRAKGLMLSSLSQTADGASSFSFLSLFEKSVDFKSKIIFTKQLAVLLRSGIPLVQSIELLTEQFENPFKRILVSVRDGLRDGNSLATELSRYPKIFTNVYIQLVRAGEATGKLEIILERLTGYMERTEETSRKVRKALSYPIMLLSFAFLVVLGVLTFLVPSMTDMLKKAGKELPGPTQIMVNISDFLFGYYPHLIIGITSFVTLFLYWRSTPEGKYRLDEIFLKTPFIQYFSKTKAVVQFCKTLGMLLESGVNLSEALDIVSNIVDNKVLVRTLQQARDKIIKEGKIARYLKETGIFPPIASYMISTGEQSGNLAGMLLTVGSDYEVELNDITDGITEKISPIMMIFMAFIVGFIILAIFLPVMEAGDIGGI